LLPFSCLSVFGRKLPLLLGKPAARQSKPCFCSRLFTATLPLLGILSCRVLHLCPKNKTMMQNYFFLVYITLCSVRFFYGVKIIDIESVFGGGSFHLISGMFLAISGYSHLISGYSCSHLFTSFTRLRDTGIGMV